MLMTGSFHFQNIYVDFYTIIRPHVSKILFTIYSKTTAYVILYLFNTVSIYILFIITINGISSECKYILSIYHKDTQKSSNVP